MRKIQRQVISWEDVGWVLMVYLVVAAEGGEGGRRQKVNGLIDGWMGEYRSSQRYNMLS